MGAEKEAFQENYQATSQAFTQYSSTVCSDQQLQRYQQRLATCEKAEKLSSVDAKKRLLARTFKPVTLEKLDETLEKFKKGEAETFKDRKKNGSDSYYTQLSKAVTTLNEKLKAQNKEEITEERAEQMVERYLKNLIDKNHFCFRCSPTSFGFIAEDKMKTQMETGTSGGLNNMELRKAMTSSCFGKEKGSIDNTEYENYGYLGSYDEKNVNNTSTQFYGCMAITLNKERMKNRVSCTFGDSLDNAKTCNPSNVEAPSFASVSQQAKNYVLEAAWKKENDPDDQPTDDISMALLAQQKQENEERGKAKVREKGSPEYLELQYHGDVTVADMDEVTFTFPKFYYQLPYAELLTAEDIAEELAKPKVQEDIRVAKQKHLEESKKMLQSMREKIDAINQAPEKYGRVGREKLKLNVLEPKMD